MSETINQAKILEGLSATAVVRNDYVRSQFVNVYDAVWKQGGESAYEREAINFNKQLRDNDKLRKCTGLSVFFAFIDLAVRGLTLEPGAQALCYLLPRNHKTSTSSGDVWESRCNLTISGYGELVLRARAGQISHADNPVIVYEGDEFSYGEADGRKYVNYRCNLPRTSTKIVACFMKITRIDGSVDYSVMLENDWKRLADYSAKNNAFFDKRTQQRVEKANELYSVNGQIDAGFLMAKCVKHAFRTYPKIAIGKGTQLESEVVETEKADFDPYGGVANSEDMGNAGNAEPQQQAQPAEESFATPQDTSAGVTIDPAAQNDNDDTF